MRKVLTLLCAGLIVSAMAACGGSAEQASNEPVDPQLLVTNPSEALGASVDRFEDHVEAVEARFSFEMDFGGFAFGANGNFAYRAPESLYMTMEMSGGDETFFDFSEFGTFEVLVIGDDLYINSGLTGWVSGSIDDFSEDSGSLNDLLDGHAPLDFNALVESVGADVQYLGDTTVDGKTYTRLRITTDLASLMEDALGSFGSSGGVDEALFSDYFTSPVTMDILMDPVTFLPYTFEANGQFGSGAETGNFTLAFKFFDYNGPVDIPEPPADAKPFDEAFGDFGYSE
jgi:hypothetical protein